MSELYVTITGFRNYYDKLPLRIGNLIRCVKEPSNPHDAEAIRCFLPQIGTVGYVANSTGTVAGGTYSAGRAYDKVPDKFYIRVLFTTQSKVICKVERDTPFKILDRELEKQLQDQEDWEE